MEWGVVVWLQDHFADKQECEIGLSYSARAQTGTAAGHWKHIEVLEV